MQSLYSKLKTVASKIGTLSNDKAMGNKYGYLSEEKVTGIVRQVLDEVGLVFFGPTSSEILFREDRTTSKGSKLIYTVVKNTYKIADPETGDFEFVQIIGEGMDSGDKSINKANTGAFKYAQRQLFMISSGDDPDNWDSDTGERNGYSKGYRTQGKQQSTNRQQQNSQSSRNSNSSSAEYQQAYDLVKKRGLSNQQVINLLMITSKGKADTIEKLSPSELKDFIAKISN